MHRPGSRVWLVGLVLLALSSCHRPGRLPSMREGWKARAKPSTTKKTASARSSIELIAPHRPAERYSFGVGTCDRSLSVPRCSCALRLLRGGLPVSSVDLGPCASDPFVSVRAGDVPGLGDPLGSGDGWTAWKMGPDDDVSWVGARVLRLGPRHHGVLLHAVLAGVPRDVLVVRRGDELRAEALPGRWTAIDVRRAGLDRAGPPDERIVRFAQVRGEPGFLWAQEAIWDETSERLSFDHGQDPPVSLIASGSFATYAEAATEAERGCLRGAVVAPTDAYEGLVPGRYFVGALSGDARLAAAATRAAERCGPAGAATVVPLRFRWLPRGRVPLGTNDQQATFGLGRYDGQGWPLLVARDGAPRDRRPIEVSWPAAGPDMAPATDVELPAGDPLRPLRGPAGWSIGAGGSAALVALQTVRLTVDQRALLVSMEAGFEHRSRRHDLVVAEGDRLRVAWSAIDPVGPSWSTVVVRPREGSTDDFVHLSVFAASEEGQVDRLEATRVRWDAGRHEALASAVACNDPDLHLVVVREFDSLDAAVAARQEPCGTVGEPGSTGQAPWVVLAAPPGSTLRGYVLARLSTDRSLAREAIAAASRCWPRSRPVLLSWCQRSAR